MSTYNPSRIRHPLQVTDIKRWLILAIIGVGVVVTGLAWDAAQHAADPTLATREGPLSLSNPSHGLAALGLAAVVLGLGGAAWSVWRPILSTTAAKLGVVATALAGVLVIGGGAWALTNNAGEHDHASVAADQSHDAMTQTEMDPMQSDAVGHTHPALAPYSERYQAATEAERNAADTLLAETRESLIRYADVSAAVADGYQPPRAPLGVMWHYNLAGGALDGRVLDPEVPEGLVYYTPADGSTPVLVGALFVALPGTEVPMPAGDLVVWHSHRCEAFWVTPEELCDTSRRMLHVWTFDQATVETAKIDRPVTVEVTDPFGAPLKASIAVTR